MSRGYTVSAVAVMAVLGVVTWGIVTLRSPGEERALRFDQRRVEDLRRLGQSVDVFTIRNDRLPTSIQEVVVSEQTVRQRDRLVHPENVRDPETKQPYEYRVGVDLRYELCASFKRPSDESWMQERYGVFWFHPSGDHCYAFDAQEAVDKTKRQDSV